MARSISMQVGTPKESGQISSILDLHRLVNSCIVLFLLYSTVWYVTNRLARDCYDGRVSIQL